jgi:hypothetical protein
LARRHGDTPHLRGLERVVKDAWQTRRLRNPVYLDPRVYIHPHRHHVVPEFQASGDQIPVDYFNRVPDLFLLGIVSFITNFYHEHYHEMIVLPLEWMMIGSFIDIIFFSLAIGYRNRKEFDSLNLNLLEEANKQIALQQLVLQKQSELENERTRIAADMHDDLGSGLTRITYLSQMALHNDTQNNLQKIKKTARTRGQYERTDMGDETGKQHAEDLVTYIKSYAVEYLENNNIDISIAIPDSFDGLMINGNTGATCSFRSRRVCTILSSMRRRARSRLKFRWMTNSRSASATTAAA